MVNTQVPPNRGPVADQFTHSAEYDANLVTADYQEFLKRAPSAAEVDSWVRALQAGARSDQVLAAILASPEYYQRAGGTDAGWVDAVYHDLLDRSPEPVGRDYWLQTLAAGAGRSAVAQRITASPEHEGRVVAADYQKFLGRTASPEELASWVGAFEGGMSNEQIAAGFVVSNEYLLQYHGGIWKPGDQRELDLTDNWLKGVYQELLGRAPDLPGYSTWYRQLTGLTPSPDNLAQKFALPGIDFVTDFPLPAGSDQPFQIRIQTGSADGQFVGVYEYSSVNPDPNSSTKSIPISGQISPSKGASGQFTYQITFSSGGSEGTVQGQGQIEVGVFPSYLNGPLEIGAVSPGYEVSFSIQAEVRDASGTIHPFHGGTEFVF
jgi:hypothetical protein